MGCRSCLGGNWPRRTACLGLASGGLDLHPNLGPACSPLAIRASRRSIWCLHVCVVALSQARGAGARPSDFTSHMLPGFMSLETPDRNSILSLWKVS